MFKYVLIMILPFFCLFSCKQGKKHEKKDNASPVTTGEVSSVYVNYLDMYHFHFPDEIYKLPKELNEISGLGFINDSIFAAICDSRPNLYLVNINTMKIMDKLFVAQQGDFEDVTVCGDTAFILQSNGVLWMVSGLLKPGFISSDTLKLEQPFELEGLCHNASGDTLFIAAKYWHKDENKHDRELPVFAYSIKDRKLDPVPVFYIPVSLGSEKAKHPFHTSGLLRLGSPFYWIAISTNNKYIAQLNSKGKKDTVMSLNEELFNQPEGISINKNGTIFITNEGKSEKDKPTILKFTRKS